MKKVIALALAAIMALAMTACGESSTSTTAAATEAATTAAATTAAPTEAELEATNITFSFFGAETTPSGMGVAKFKELIEERSGGKITVEAYYNGTLYNQGADSEALMKGSVDMIIGSLDSLYDYIPALKATFGPYLWKNIDHYNAFWETEIGQELNKQLQDELGIHFVANNSSGWRNINLNYDAKITSRSDLEGVALRSATSEAMLAMTEALGGNPVPIAFSDTYLSIQTGVVAGNEGDVNGTVSNGLGEVLKSITLTHHCLSTNGVWVSQKSWETWTPEVQEMVVECAVEAAKTVDATVDELEVTSAQTLQDQGVIIYDLTDEERESYRQEVLEYFGAMDFASDYDQEVYQAVIECGNDF